jgi:hypothetical protein
MEANARLHAETVEPVIEERRPLTCEHDKPGTWVRLDLIRDYAARGYCCVHGHIAGEVDAARSVTPLPRHNGC